MCLMTILGPPEFDQYIAACHSCNWAGPERWERFDASGDAREHQRSVASRETRLAKETDAPDGRDAGSVADQTNEATE